MFSLLLPSFFLYLFGLFNIFGIKQDLYIKHIVFFGIGIVVFLICRRIGLQFFRVNAKPFYWLFIILLCLTYIIGLEAKGSKRWIDLYFFNFQASEFLKFFFIVFFAERFAYNRKDTHTFSFFMANLMYFLIPAFIIFKQPDLGSVMVYVFIFVSMILFTETPKRYFLFVGVLIVLFLPVAWFVLHDYQRNRILSFMNPHLDKQGTAYNMTQAIITIGSGNFLGRGLGLGTQSHLFFLPENHTDFAFASLVEQFGFLGGSVVIILYAIIAFVLIKRIITYFYQRDLSGRFNFFVTVGFFSFLIVQIFVNIGMNLGLLPIAGITLPLISYGGSSLITMAIGLALLPN